MRPIAATALLLALAGCERTPQAPNVSVEHGAVSLPAIPGRPGAAYFTLRTSTEPMRLMSVTSPRVERIELHETRQENGVSRMVSLNSPSFPSGGELEFKPGGGHAMLIGLDPQVKAGDRIPLTFTFDAAPPETVQAEVHGPGGHSGH